ncbi:MAG: retroviral-like aspartic protease family protein [Bacteroidaceae bacterium]|nr:retroviral-like aspartic protease family protein [Bacteroidaceae bacterium]
MYKYFLSILLCLIFLSACESKKKKLSFYDLENTAVDTTVYTHETQTIEETPAEKTDVIAIPFTENIGVKYIEVKINRTIGVNMIIDNGCADAQISVEEANYLYKKGVLSEDDILGTAAGLIADGSITEDMVVNLREIIIGDRIICPNVKATVSSNTNAPLLLGNEILNRTASYTIDNENNVILFKLKQ